MRLGDFENLQRRTKSFLGAGIILNVFSSYFGAAKLVKKCWLKSENTGKGLKISESVEAGCGEEGDLFHSSATAIHRHEFSLGNS